MNERLPVIKMMFSILSFVTLNLKYFFINLNKLLPLLSINKLCSVTSLHLSGIIHFHNLDSFVNLFHYITYIGRYKRFQSNIKEILINSGFQRPWMLTLLSFKLILQIILISKRKRDNPTDIIIILVIPFTSILNQTCFGKVSFSSLLYFPKLYSSKTIIYLILYFDLS